MATAPTTPPVAGPALSEPPSANDPDNFPAEGDAFLGSLPAFQEEMQDAKDNVFENAEITFDNTMEVAANAAAVEANTTLVQTSAAAAVWTAGTYDNNDRRCSPGNGRIYYFTAADGTSSATDPKDDGAKWSLVSPLMKQVTEARATAAIASGVLNLDMLNGIIGVTMNANVTSLTLSNNAATASACHCVTLETTGDGTPRTFVWPNGNGTSTLLFKWAGGTAPTLTSTNGKRDTFFFKSVSQFLFDAYIVGQNA